jgi:Gamma interferon inducible lysosomal thiol reductase (GILT)
MHGPGECLGNIIQLCAAKVYPDPKIYLGFANCMTSDYQEIPARALVEDCALEFGLDFQTLNACISDEGEGLNLLRASVERSHHENVTKSCTVRLAGKIRCIRDSGEWYDCPGGSNVSDLVTDINDLYDDLN